MVKKLSLGLATLLLLAASGLFGWYQLHNSETEELTDAARAQAPGKFVRLSEGITHYQIAGPTSGQVVVLEHGWSVPFYIWDGPFEAMVGAGFRVLRYDRYGRGYSDRPNVIYDSALYETQLLELLAALKIEGPIDHAGISMGGGVVGAFTAHHPEMVRKVILVAPVFESRDVSSIPEFVARYRTMTESAPTMAQRQLGDFYRPERFPDWPERYRVQMQYKGFVRALTSDSYHFATSNHRENYQTMNRLNKDVLLVWGSEDQVITAANMASLRQVLDVEFVAVEEAGHIPYMERPEIVNRFIAFLKDDDH